MVEPEVELSWRVEMRGVVWIEIAAESWGWRLGCWWWSAVVGHRRLEVEDGVAEEFIWLDRGSRCVI